MCDDCEFIPGMTVQIVRIGLPPPVMPPGEKTKRRTEADRLTHAYQLQCIHGDPIGVGLVATAEQAELYIVKHGWQVADRDDDPGQRMASLADVGEGYIEDLDS